MHLVCFSVPKSVKKLGIALLSAVQTTVIFLACPFHIFCCSFLAIQFDVGTSVFAKSYFENIYFFFTVFFFLLLLLFFFLLNLPSIVLLLGQLLVDAKQ